MNMSSDQIRAGLLADEFVPFFQPVVTLHTGEVAGVEILADGSMRALEFCLPEHSSRRRRSLA